MIKYLMIYVLIGFFITTLTIKVMLDSPSDKEKLLNYFKTTPMSVILGCIAASLIWPTCFLKRKKK